MQSARRRPSPWGESYPSSYDGASPASPLQTKHRRNQRLGHEAREVVELSQTGEDVDVEILGRRYVLHRRIVTEDLPNPREKARPQSSGDGTRIQACAANAIGRS